MYTRVRSLLTATRARSHELGTPSVPNIQEGTIVLSVRVGFTDAQQEGEVIDQDSTGICDGPPYRSMYFGYGDVVGEYVRVLVEGAGWWKCRGFGVPRDPLV